MQQVHIRVNDAATGTPTPVRLRIIDADGRYYAPHGRLENFATGPNQDVGGNVVVQGEPWAYIDGACEINLPPGPLHVSIAKGPEYRPVEADVELAPGKLALRFQTERWIDARKQGWFSGDTRVHFLPPHAALLQAQAEDIAVGHLLIRQEASGTPGRPTAIPNLEAFSGQKPCLEIQGHVIVVNTENYHRQLGSLGLLHCHRVVYPLTFGGPAGVDDWTLEDWCRQCHRKNGLVVWTRMTAGDAELDLGEPFVDLLLGQVDALEVTARAIMSPALWHDLWNIGLRVPLAGASGKDSNASVLGSTRTYVQLPPGQELTLPAWIEGLRAGRSLISTGPLLDLAVEGQTPGSVLRMTAGTVHVRAEAKSLTPFEQLRILQNGKVIAEAKSSGDPLRASIQIDVPVERTSWFAAECSGASFAHCSPVYVETPGLPLAVDQDAASRLLRTLDDMIAWCRNQANCTTAPMRERLTSGFLQARAILERRRG